MRPGAGAGLAPPWTPCFFVVAVVQLLSCVRLFATLWTVAYQAPLSIISWSLLKFTSVETMMLSNHLSLSPLSPLAFSLSQHQGLFQLVSSSHQVAKVLDFSLIIVIPHQQMVKKVFTAKGSTSFSPIKSSSVCRVWAFLKLKPESVFIWSYFSCMRSLSLSLDLHTYPRMAMHACRRVLICKSVCTRVHILYCMCVHMHTHRFIKSQKPELNSVLVLAASHFILETFPDKWPFTFL